MNGPGLHLIVDARTMMSFTQDYLETYLAALVILVGMTIIKKPEAWGERSIWVGWTLLAESHAVIHVHGDVVHAEVFSCKSFDIGLASGFMVQRLKLTEITRQVIERPMPEAVRA